MIFEYSVQKTFTESVDVVDAGNTALKCTSKNGFEYWVIVKTVMGKTHIIKFGPICQDIPILLEDFAVSYKKLDYKEGAIYKEIDKYINDFRKEVTQVEEATEYEAWQNFPEIQFAFENV